jgi:hypothetical protein
MNTTKKKYIEEIKRFSKKLEKAARWQKSKRSIGYIERAKQKSYVYEFYCYIRIIADLKRHYNIVYVPGNTADPHKFPKAAAEKINSPRFDLYDKKTSRCVYQVCVGTKVGSSITNKEVHPDITFQTANAPNNPEAKHLLLMMDAKFKKNSTDTLPFDEVLAFIGFVNIVYELNRKTVPKILFDKLHDILGNTILTNGRAHDVIDSIHKTNKIKEVEMFDVGKNYKVKG